MEFKNTFHVPLPLDEAWKLMLDVPRILPCLPGATLKEAVGNTYLGAVAVRLGPIKLAFDGKAELVRQDDVQHVAWLVGSGLDPKGRGSAQSEFSFALVPAAGGGTDVTVTTQLTLSGSVAQYGRGSGMIAEVAGHILKQFEQNLAASLQGDQSIAQAAPAAVANAAVAGVAGDAASAPLASPAAPAVGTMTSPEAQAVLLQAQAVLAQSQAVLAATQALLAERRNPPLQAAQPQELNMLGIGLKAAWSQLRSTLGAPFRRG